VVEVDILVEVQVEFRLIVLDQEQVDHHISQEWKDLFL
jgi:hypothetical protein